MDCVLILFRRRLNSVQVEQSGTQGKGAMGTKPSWSESLKMMTSSAFLQNLMTYNKDLINEEMVELLEPYLRMEDYNMLSAKKVVYRSDINFVSYYYMNKLQHINNLI